MCTPSLDYEEDKKGEVDAAENLWPKARMGRGAKPENKEEFWNWAKPKKPHRDAFEGETGLVLQYKPFILAEAKKYSQRYKLPFNIFIRKAIEIARKVEEKFDPSRGLNFTTLLRKHLLGLNRIAHREYRSRYGRKPKTWVKPESKRRRSHRQRAIELCGDERGRIQWADHVPRLRKLQEDSSLTSAEVAVLDWMINPPKTRRTYRLEDAARIGGIGKGQASKVRYRLLLKSHSLKIA